MPDGLEAFEELFGVLDAKGVKLLCSHLAEHGSRRPEDLLDECDISPSFLASLLTRAFNEGLLVRFNDGSYDLSAEGRRRTCRHRKALPVESVVTGETLARLCPDCGTQLEVHREAAM